VAVAPDGSPVDLYLRLPPRGEAEVVHAAIHPAAVVLELGCGAGRVTHELIRLGHPVVAVDESLEMLAHIRGAEIVHGRIECLDLRRRFPCVLLASHLVNVDDNCQREALLRTCAKHVADDGVVLIERHEPDWHPEEGAIGNLGEFDVALSDLTVDAPHISATVEYRTGGRSWRHPFTARILDEPELDNALEEVGLARAATLGERGAWVAARLYSGT
jgi:SAM-dependent methyltransferase